MERKDIYKMFEGLLTIDRIERIDLLVHSEDGWDGKDAKSCSYESFLNAKNFLTEIDNSKCKNIAIFLSYDGALLFEWFYKTEDKEESLILEFLNNEIRYFDSLNMDDSEPLGDNKQEFISKIKKYQNNEDYI